MASTRWTRDAPLLVGALAALAVAGLVATPSSSRASAALWEARGSAVGLRSTASTALWLRAVPTFGSAVLDHARHDAPLQPAIAPIAEDLDAATRLDPSFDDPWLGGALMLHVLEGPAGPRRRDLIRSGQSARPDLPWHLIAAEAIP